MNGGDADEIADWLDAAQAHLTRYQQALAGTWSRSPFANLMQEERSELRGCYAAQPMAPFLLTACIPFCLLDLVPSQEPGAAASRPATQSRAISDAALRSTIGKAVHWIGTQGLPVKGDADAWLFPATAESPKDPEPQIYGGTAGVLLFLENAAALLPDPRADAMATRVMRGLLATRTKTPDGQLTWMSQGMAEGATSLYVGDAGIGQAFLTRARLRNDKEALAIAVELGDSILARGKRDKDMLSWDHQVEIIYGASGTILFLLDLGAVTGEARFVAGAKAAAHWLVAQAKASTAKAADGSEVPLLSWRWALAGNAPYVNFSHGTAGVAYALARVGAVTKDDVCMSAALRGTAWLDQQALNLGDGVAWPVVSGKKTILGGWCHGAPGTGRLYLLLHEITGDSKHLATAIASARWVMAQAPASTVSNPAFPPSFCCGVAGVVDFFCDLHRATGDPEFATFARRAAAYLVAAAQVDGDGVKWTQGATAHGATGSQHALDLMLGAPGEALALLRVLTLDTRPDPVCHLPDRRVTK